MNVYAGSEGRRRLIGQARVPWDQGPILVVPPACEQFAIHSIRCPGAEGNAIETAVLISPGQRPEMLPGWRPIWMGPQPLGITGLVRRLAQAMSRRTA